MTKTNKNIPTMIHMPLDLRRDLKSVCKKTGLSMSDVVREATRREILRLRVEHPTFMKPDLVR